MKFCNNDKTIGKHIQNPLFHSMKIISPNLVAVFSKPSKVVLDKPITIGSVILDRSKDIMIRAFYEQILPRLKGTEVTVLWSDTDSFGLKCVNKTPTCHLSKLRDIMDFSNYNKQSPWYDNSRAQALFYFKNELPNQTLTRYAGLRSKTYCLDVVADNGESKFTAKAKGVCSGYKRTLKMEHFVRCINEISTHSVTQFHIRSKNHQVATEKCQRVSFNSFDSKRYLYTYCERTYFITQHTCKHISHVFFVLGKIHSSPFGSWLIEWSEKNKKCPFCT